MSSKFREISIDVGGRAYRLVIDINAMRAVEAAMSTDTRDVTFQEVTQRALKGSLTAIVAMYWGAMRRYHPDMTMDLVGDWIGEVDQEELASKTTSMLSSTTPDEADVKALGIKKATRPRSAQVA